MRFKKIIVCIRVEFDSIMTWRQFSTYRNKSLEKKISKNIVLLTKKLQHNPVNTKT